MTIIGGDTFDGTTMTVIGGGSVTSIAAAISLAVPEKRRQLQAEEVGGQVHVSSGSRSFFPDYLLKKSISLLMTIPKLDKKIVKKMVKKFKRPHSDWKICVKCFEEVAINVENEENMENNIVF
ncbi:hypothetical protein Lser_V15G09452 [Lactuca serriola]